MIEPTDKMRKLAKQWANDRSIQGDEYYAAIEAYAHGMNDACVVHTEAAAVFRAEIEAGIKGQMAELHAEVTELEKGHLARIAELEVQVAELEKGPL